MRLVEKESSSYDTLKVEKADEFVGILTINRPEKMNALSAKVFEELGHFFDSPFMKSIRALIITGAGDKSFVAGADISELHGLSQNEASELSKRGQDVFTKIESAQIPIIAAVNGFALGGGLELALACSFRIASTNARFGLPEVGIGLMPGYGGTQRLSPIIGIGRAIEMVTTGAMIDADKAEEFGLVNTVVEQDELRGYTLKIATKISKNAPLAVNAALSATRMSLHSAEFETESHIFGSLFETLDAKEGIQAFLEKRKAHFTGN